MDLSLVYIIIGGLWEPVWVWCLNKTSHSEGRLRLEWGVLFVITSITSVFFLGLGIQSMNIGIAYAIWTAVGSITTLLISRVFLGEGFDKRKVIAVFLILTGIIGLELSGGL
jgi:multidrug transporter EmrE-like cation transporter